MKHTKIYAPDNIDLVMIFIGSMTKQTVRPVLLSALKWHKEADSNGYLTLDEIRKQLATDELITVVVETPLSGVIYQCSNYASGVWVEHGTTKGYA